METNTNLLIHFPKTHFRIEQVEKAKRHYQDEWVISETTGQHFELGQNIGFVTILIPHSGAVQPEKLVSEIKYVGSEFSGKGMSVEIHRGDRIIHVGVKNNFRMDMIRDFRRPKYTYESGKITFGPMETNGDFFFTERKGNTLDYTIVNLTKAMYEDQLLFEQHSGYFGLAFDGSSDVSGVSKARYWRDKVKVE